MIILCTTRNMRGYKPTSGGKHRTMNRVSTEEITLHTNNKSKIYYSKYDNRYYTEIVITNKDNKIIVHGPNHCWMYYIRGTPY